MSDLKQVKVDNWGIYFLQRLKHFFNRTDYCDLTLQFQDNAQLKVHRLVLSACTEYFELLERTCEMYEDCLVMPDDLQADVVVPIVNFMYTGQLEFKMDLLERLHQTSQIMNMPVLTKLLDAQIKQLPKSSCVSISNYSDVKHYSKADMTKKTRTPTPSTSNTSNKRSFVKAFDSSTLYSDRPNKKRESVTLPSNGVQYCAPLPVSSDPIVASRKFVHGEPRPTRYELPEEIDADTLLDTSFTNISYTSKPLMVHPETSKRYIGKKPSIFSDASASRNLLAGSTLEIVECKKLTKSEKMDIFDAPSESIADEGDIFGSSFLNLKEESTSKDSSQLFDQILDNNSEVNKTPKVTIETKDNKQAKLDHAKIISEVLKKYPHLMKGNKNIKLKILNTSSKANKIKPPPPPPVEVKEEKPVRGDSPGFTYETDVLDSKEAAKLIALGAENINGPWICLICGTPGRALHFTTYYKFRCHLVEVHNEKPILSLCEYCGLRSTKRNYMLHHLYTKHNIEPPPHFHFPKCNICNYIALTEGFLIKHKASHAENRNFRCNVCSASFGFSNQLLVHIQKTGHKYSAERNKLNLQCIYCQKVFLRESNLYAHLKTSHKHEAKNDCIIEDSDEEKSMMKSSKVYSDFGKYELPVTYENEYDIKAQYQIEEKPDGNIQVVNKTHKYDNPNTFENQYNNINTKYQIEEKPDGNIQIVTKKASISASPKQKILNPGFHSTLAKPQKAVKNIRNIGSIHNEFPQDYNVNSPESSNDEIIMINDNEYILKDNQLIERKKIHSEKYIVSDMIRSNADQTFTPTTSMGFNQEYTNTNPGDIEHKSETILKKQDINQPIQIVVSNNEEYKNLMSSNHSIIFGNNNDTKTLTVLSAPHSSSTLNTSAIDLDNTQSNDMMIIQDDYPLNVSEAVVTANNSNIVVVYSHPVDSQNKQYQFITTQNLETQFVQSSTILTQNNYENVTTSASAQAINDTWQNNIHQTIEDAQMAIASNSEIQAITLTEKVPVQMNIHELPAIQLISKHPQTVIVKNPNEEILHQQTDSSENADQIIDQEITEETQNSTIPMNSNVLLEVVEGKNAGTEIEENNASIISEEKNSNVISNCQQSEKNVELDDTNHEIAANTQMETHETELIVEENSQKLEEDASKISIKTTEENNFEIEVNVIAVENTTEEFESAITTEEIENPDIDNITNTEVVTDVTNHENSNVVNEQIQNLTSEWSEEEADDDDTSTQENKTIKKYKNEKKRDAETQEEIEESVENIQQEMQKQMLEIKCENPKDDSSNSQEQDEQSQKKNGTRKKADTPVEKIPSLLNDRDESDSQEASIDNTNANENDAMRPDESYTCETSTDLEELEPETASPEKTDKIKSLVSDWDDEDEEGSETVKENI